MAEANGVEQAIIKAGGGTEGIAKLAELFGCTPQAITNFRRKGWFPPERAQQVSDVYGIPVAELVRSDIRQLLNRA